MKYSHKELFDDLWWFKNIGDMIGAMDTYFGSFVSVTGHLYETKEEPNRLTVYYLKCPEHKKLVIKFNREIQ